MKRRVLLAQALVAAPDLLLLDEPTNHLDIESIAWLEEFLKNYAGSVVFVTHDRGFLRNLATRIIEIDRGQVTSWPGDYDELPAPPRGAPACRGAGQRRCSTRSWRRKKSGSARASRPAARATKAASPR